MIDPSTETPDLKHSRRRKANGAPNGSHSVDRLPPHSIEAEQGVLGAILLSPNENMGECLSRIKVGSEVFYDLRHQTIFAAMVEMFDRREGIDLITLQQYLKDRKQLDEVGGIAYLSSLVPKK